MQKYRLKEFWDGAVFERLRAGNGLTKEQIMEYFEPVSEKPKKIEKINVGKFYYDDRSLHLKINELIDALNSLLEKESL